MNKLQQLFVGVAALGLAGAANALPNYAAVQAVLDSVTVGPTAGASSVDAATDWLVSDAEWAIGGSGGSISTIVVELAGNAAINAFGIYSGGSYVQLFSGPQGAGAQALVSILLDGSVVVNFADTGIDFAGNQFGFYLGNGTDLFHSDTADNADGFDHMLAYEGQGDTIQILPFAAGVWGSNEYVLAWDDLYGGGDEDYNDLVVLVESVTPVPEPSVLALLGAGLLGLGLSRRRT